MPPDRISAIEDAVRDFTIFMWMPGIVLVTWCIPQPTGLANTLIAALLLAWVMGLPWVAWRMLVRPFLGEGDGHA